MPAIRRTIKQFVYAVTFLAIVLFIIAVVIIPRLSIFQRMPPPEPEVKESIIVESVDTVTHNGAIDIVARVRNPNARFGVPQYNVTFSLLDKNDAELDIITQETYLLPGSLNYIAALDIPIIEGLARVKVVTPGAPTFATTPDYVTEPTFNSFTRGRFIKNIGVKQSEVQIGIVVNTSSFGFQHVDITGVALDSEGKVVGIGKTFVGELKSGEQREFTLQWPAPGTPTERVIILPSTNIYEPNNVLSTVGDPNLLREAPE